MKKPEVDPIQILYFGASIWVNDERRLRSLESKKSPKDTHVDCKLDKDFDEVSGCYSTQKVKGIIEENARLTIESESVRNIAGFPDKFDTDKMNNKVDYSDPEILKKIGELDKIKIIEIDGYNCHKNGQLNITGETNSEKELNITDVDINFSTPESGGLCSISIQNKAVEIICQNKEKFGMSQIVIDRSIIEDYEGTPYTRTVLEDQLNVI